MSSARYGGGIVLEGMLGPPVTQHIVDHMTASPHSGKPEAPGRERKGGGGGGGFGGKCAVSM